MEKSPSALSSEITDEPKGEQGKTAENVTQVDENEALSKTKNASKEEIEPKEEIETKEEIVSLRKEDAVSSHKGETESSQKGETASSQKGETVSLQKGETASLAKQEIVSMPKEVSSANIIDPQQKSEVDLNTLLEIGSEDLSESKQEESEIFYPFGEDYIPLTPKIIDDKKKLLGIIRLYWPVLPDISLQHFPDSYKLNSNKEKVLLLYAENFRKQYHANFPTKKPLLLAAENECGVQKMVSTTIRPTKLCYPELHTWQGCANFVADHIVYEPLECPHLMPEQVVSGRMVLERQSGHCFEMAILLTSYLIAAGYDAYVASGYATKDYCQNDLTRTTCPDIPDITEKVKPPDPPVECKYTVREPRDLRSKFLLMMEQREKDKEEQERLRLEEEERKRIAELEKFPHDPLYWWGIHGWVVVLPGKREVENVIFIHPGSGVASGPEDEHYLGIESLWNHRNYWVNVQDCDTCQELSFELQDVDCWEHLLAGEPWELQEVAKEIDLDDKERILLEKHLDMPPSWVQRLEVPHNRYEQRYPLGHKSTNYKKARVEKFAPYLHEDGLVCRVTTYTDYNYEEPEVEYEMFKNREDCLYRSIRYLFPEKIIDDYDKGREDALKRQTRYPDEGKRVMEFYYQVRYDSLRLLELTPVYMEEHFEDRDDRLYHRYVTFDARTKMLNKWSITDGIVRRSVTKIVEKFHRNPELVADKDIARREFDIANEEINLNYHYADDKITAGTRHFIKPPVTEQGDKLKFNSRLTSGYVVDTAAPPHKKMELFWLLEDCLQAEQESLKHVRDMEDEIMSIMKNLLMETAEPKLKISIFDEERNSAAKEGMKKREQELKEQTVREVEAETDYLAVYLVQFADQTEPLTVENLRDVRQYCLNDYRQLLVDRANKMQAKFDKVSDELQAKHQWYDDLGMNASHEDEELYVMEVRRLAFKLHTLELRLIRHKDLASVRYKMLEEWLKNDPRMAPLYA